MIKHTMILILSVQASSDLGEYHFYKNVGGVFYDYSGSGYHAINGEIVLEDPHDVTSTDRGAYFDGVSSYIKVHDSLWKHAVFSNDWSTISWVYPVEVGAIISRFRHETGQMNAVFELITGNNGAVSAYSCLSSTCTYNSVNINKGLLVLNQWYLLSTRIYPKSDFIDSIARIDYQANYSGIGNLSGLYTEETGTYTTYLGTDFITFYRGFIYNIRFRNGATNRTYFSNESGCPSGFCYYSSVADTALCSCTACPKHPFTTCLSDCSDISTSADCLPCSSCSGICYSSQTSDTSLTCLSCPKQQWPSCDLDNTPLNSLLCSSQCLSCVDPSPTGCLSCSLPYSNIDPFSSLCSCPLFSFDNDLYCQCYSGYLMLFYQQTYTCSPCLFPCQDCLHSPSFCTSCRQGVLTPLNTCLICPSATYTSSSFTCEPCKHDCLDCSDADQCYTCKFLNSYPDSQGNCLCEPRFYKTNEGCVECRSLCKTCESELECVECEQNAHMSNNVCVCDDLFSEIDGKCEDRRFFASVTSTNHNCLFLDFQHPLKNTLRSSHLSVRIQNDPSFSWELSFVNSTRYRVHLFFKQSLKTNSLVTVDFPTPLLSVYSGFLATNSTSASLSSFSFTESSTDWLGVLLRVFSGVLFCLRRFSGGCLWTYINFIQLLLILPLTSSPLNNDLIAFFKSFLAYFPVPSLSHVFLDSPPTTSFGKVFEAGIETSDFFWNTSGYLIVGIALFWGLFCIETSRLLGYSSEAIEKAGRSLKWGGVVRWGVEVFLEVSLFSLLQVLDVSFKQPDFLSFRGRANFVVCCMFIV